MVSHCRSTEGSIRTHLVVRAEHNVGVALSTLFSIIFSLSVRVVKVAVDSLGILCVRR